MDAGLEEGTPGLDSLMEYSEIIRKMFDSEEEGIQFYNGYAYEKGFSVRKDYCEWDGAHAERTTTLRKLVCSSQGFRAEKELNREDRKRRPRNVTRFGCPAKFVIAEDQNGQWWTMEAKRGFPPVRKSVMYDYSDSLQRFNELCPLGEYAAFKASQSPEAFERLKRVLIEEAAIILPNGGENGRKRFGPVLPQAPDVDSAKFSNVMDPMRVPGRGAPKKKLKSISDKSRKRCTVCTGEGHNRRTCSMRNEDSKLPEDVVDR